MGNGQKPSGTKKDKNPLVQKMTERTKAISLEKNWADKNLPVKMTGRTKTLP
jgi:hypothetical protein